jgi:hypothetical protein
MKIKKNGKVINLTESDLRRIVKKVIKEQDEAPVADATKQNKPETFRFKLIDPNNKNSKSIEMSVYHGKRSNKEGIIVPYAGFSMVGDPNREVTTFHPENGNVLAGPGKSSKGLRNLLKVGVPQTYNAYVEQIKSELKNKGLNVKLYPTSETKIATF